MEPSDRYSSAVIRTPDQRLRVFISSTIKELEPERAAVKEAIERLHLIAVLFELGARPHPPRDLYRAYLEQSHIFVGIYWESYGWVAPEMEISGLEDEFLSAGRHPKLIYIKDPAPDRDPKLRELLERIKHTSEVSYKSFSTPDELAALVQNDMALLLSERFETGADDTTSDLRTPSSDIPVVPTALIGRDREMQNVSSLLMTQGVRLVSLVGPGGIGKTRLAIEVAHSLTDRFNDGVHFAPLALVVDPQMVPAAIAHAMGIPEEDRRSLKEVLTARLATAEALLVLDNFEQIVDAAPVVSDLLAAAPLLKVLVTSRAVLRLRGEFEFPVQPLSLPRRGTDVAGATESAAVQLFLERAMSANPNLELDEASTAAIVEICRRLDGLPLAIELAAARVRILAPQQLLERLSSRFEVLTGGYRDLPARQQTLRSAIDWSYELLDEDERTLFARLSVFVGGRSLDAVEHVCDPDHDIDVLTVATSLVDKSLLRQVESRDGEPRFTMLETLHEYALEQLRAGGEERRLRSLHAEYFLELAEGAKAELRGPNQAKWLQALHTDHDNLHAALAWSAEQEDANAFLRLVYAMWNYWTVRAYLIEAKAWAEKVSSMAHKGAPEFAARGLFAAGEIAHATADPLNAESYYLSALAIAHKAKDREGIATLKNVLGHLSFERSDIPEARVLYEQALQLFIELNDVQGKAQALKNLGRVAAVEKDWNKSIALLEESMKAFEEEGDQQGVARSFLNLGVTHREAGNPKDAALYIKESTRLWNQLGGKWDLIECVEDWAANETLQQNDVEAARAFGTAERARERIGVPLWFFEENLLRPYWEQLRKRLGSVKFNELHQEGRGLDLQEAIDRILAE
jgi:predicted ATPase